MSARPLTISHNLSVPSILSKCYSCRQTKSRPSLCNVAICTGEQLLRITSSSTEGHDSNSGSNTTSDSITKSSVSREWIVYGSGRKSHTVRRWFNAEDIVSGAVDVLGWTVQFDVKGGAMGKVSEVVRIGPGSVLDYAGTSLTWLKVVESAVVCGDELGERMETHVLEGTFASGTHAVLLKQHTKSSSESILLATEVLVPVVDEIVKGLDIENRTLTICPPQGLLELARRPEVIRRLHPAISEFCKQHPPKHVRQRSTHTRIKNLGLMPTRKQLQQAGRQGLIREINVKEYPGFNFVGLILGPQDSTKKRLEEETGTKIIVQGMGDAEEGKIPGIHLDGRKVSSVSEDLPVHISADTYEKVDAAMGLLELLVTTVDGNIPPGGTNPALSSGDSSKALDQGGGVLDTRYSIASSELSQSTALPVLITSSGPQPMPLGWSLPASTTEAPGGQFRPPPGNWNLMAANNSAMQVPVGFSMPPNSSSHTMNNGNMFFPRFPRSGFSPFHPFPFVRGRPPLQGFNPHAMPLNLRNTMFGPGVRARQPFHVQPRPYIPETVSQNQSAAVMNPTGGVFGSPRPHPVPGGSSQSAYPVYPTGSNATLVLPPSNPMVGGGAGPPVFREGNSASASLAAGPLPSTSLPATSYVPVSVQHSEGAYQRDSQFSGQPSNQLSHSGTAIQLSSGAPPGAHAAPAPPVASPVGPSPRLSPAAPPGAHGGAPPPVASPVGPSPRLSPAAPPGAHGGAPPPVASLVVPSAANVPLGPPPRVAFIPQAASAGLSPVALPVISSSSNPPSSSILALGGGMHNTVTISLGAPVGTMQSGTANRSIGQPPVSAGSTLIISQGSSVPASAAANTWQPQHLTSGDFTFQPLRSQAPPSSSVWSQPSQPPSLADVCPQNPIPQNPVPQNPVSVMRPGFQPVIPSFPLSLPPQIRVNAPSPPAPPTPPAPPAPPMPPLPPQAPSFRPAISPSSSSLGISSQPVFSVPSQLSGSQSFPPPIPPPRPAFLVPTAQPMPPRPPPVVLNPPVVPPFGSSAPQALRPPLPPMPHPGPDNHPPLPTVPGIPNFQRQEALTSQPFQHPSVSNIPVPPRGLHPVSTSQGFVGNSSAAFSGDVSKQLPGPVLLQQQSSPTVLHNNSAVPSNIQHNPMSTSPQLQLPASPQLRPIVPGQSQASMIPVSGTHGFDFGHGGSDKTSHLPVSTGEGASNQSYDPFSPTSIPAEQTHLQNDEMKIVTSKTDQNAAGPHDRQDTDAEYENLMASVGVR